MSSILWPPRVGGIGRRRWVALAVSSLAGCRDEAITRPVPPAPVASVTVMPVLTAVIVGSTQQFVATTRDGRGDILTGRVVEWATSDGSKASVSASGLVTAIADGPIRITATSEGTRGFADAIVVTLPVASVAVTPLAATVRMGSTQRLTAQPLSNTGQPLPGHRAVAWSSSDVATATVDTSGVVTAVAAGTALITAACEGQSASARITVVP